MPDISMCGNQDCPIRGLCYRSPDSGTQPKPRWQTWSAFTWREANGQPVCDAFWPVEGVNVMRALNSGADHAE